MPDGGLIKEDGATHCDRLARAAERESRAMVAIARSLRLTHQSQVRPETAGRQVARQPVGPMPWEFTGNEEGDSPSEYGTSSHEPPN